MRLSFEYSNVWSIWYYYINDINDGNLTIVNEYMQSYLISTVLLLFVYLYAHKYIILTIYNDNDNSWW